LRADESVEPISTAEGPMEDLVAVAVVVALAVVAFAWLAFVDRA
jgi:hypothetical protein